MTHRKIDGGATRQESTALVHEPGALQQWWIELRHGARTVHTADALYEAACAEARGREWARLGINKIANDERRRAAEIILDAARKRVRQ